RAALHQGAQRRLPPGAPRQRHHHARDRRGGGRADPRPGPVLRREERPAQPQARADLQADRRPDEEAPGKDPHVGTGRQEVTPPGVLRWRILRKSLDARDKDALHFVYTAEVAVPEDEARVAARAARAGRAAARVDLYAEEPFVAPPPGARPLPHRPVVVGSG